MGVIGDDCAGRSTGSPVLPWDQQLCGLYCQQIGQMNDTWMGNRKGKQERVTGRKHEGETGRGIRKEKQEGWTPKRFTDVGGSEHPIIRSWDSELSYHLFRVLRSKIQEEKWEKMLNDAFKLRKNEKNKRRWLETETLVQLLAWLSPFLSPSLSLSLSGVGILGPYDVSLIAVMDDPSCCTSLTQVASLITRQLIAFLLVQRLTVAPRSSEMKLSALLLLHMMTSNAVGRESVAFAFHHLSAVPCLHEVMIPHRPSSHHGDPASPLTSSPVAHPPHAPASPNYLLASSSPLSSSTQSKTDDTSSRVCVSLLLTVMESAFFPHVAMRYELGIPVVKHVPFLIVHCPSLSKMCQKWCNFLWQSSISLTPLALKTQLLRRVHNGAVVFVKSVIFAPLCLIYRDNGGIRPKMVEYGRKWRLLLIRIRFLKIGDRKTEKTILLSKRHLSQFSDILPDSSY